MSKALFGWRSQANFLFERAFRSFVGIDVDVVVDVDR